MIRLLDQAGVSANAPPEWEPMWVEALIPQEIWAEAELRISEAVLPLMLRRLAGETRVLAEWPRSGPGNYELLLRLSGEEHRLTFSIRPAKITEAAYSRLLEDVQTRLPAAVALGLKRLGGLAGLRLLPPQQSTLAEELLRLSRAIKGLPGRPGLADVCVQIGLDPHQVLETREYWVRRDQARRPHPARLVHALTRSGNLAVDLRPARVIDSRVEHSVDVYENRLLKTFVQQVDRRLRRLHGILEATRDNAMLAATRALSSQLRKAQRHSAFLTAVSELSHAPDRVSMVLLHRPAYRAALEGFLEFQRSVSMRLEDDALDAPLENLPYLYQVWGTLSLIVALLDVGREMGFVLRQNRLVGRGPGGVFVRILPDGQPAVVLTHPADGRVVRLVPERSYGSSGRLRSITFSQRPDIAIEVDSANRDTGVWVFDPKYKLDGELLDPSGPPGPKKVDIDKMHAYRDAIRNEQGLRTVKYAAILYPGPQRIYPDGIEALSSDPEFPGVLESRLESVLREALT